MSKEQSFEENDPIQRHYSARSASGTYGAGPMPQNVSASQRFPPRASSAQDTPFIPVRRESITQRSREPQFANVRGSDDRQSTGMAPNSNSISADKFIPPIEAYSMPESVYYTPQKPDRLPKSQPGPTPRNAGQQYRSNSLPPPQIAHSPYIPHPYAPQTAPQTFNLFGTRPAQGTNSQPAPTVVQPPFGSYPINPYSHPTYNIPYAGPQKMDAFVATDPFRSHSRSKNEPDTTNLTFDNIPAMDFGLSYRHYPTLVPATYPSYADPYSDQHYFRPPIVPYSPFQPYPSHVPQYQPSGSTPPVIFNPDDASTYPAPGDIRPTPNENATSVPISSTMSGRPLFGSAVGQAPSNKYTAPTGTSSTANKTAIAEPMPTVAGRPLFGSDHGHSTTYNPAPAGINPTINETTTSETLPATNTGPTSYESEQLPSTAAVTLGSTTKPSPEERETPVEEFPLDDAFQGRLSPVRRTDNGEQSPVSEYNDPDGDPHKTYSSEHPNGYSPYIPPHSIDVGEKKTSFWSALGRPFVWPFTRAKPSPKYEDRPSFGYPPGFMPGVAYAAESQATFSRVAKDFVTRTLPTQVYLHVLLRLPSLYFSRVARIFEEADLTLPELKKMALETTSKDRGPRPDTLHIFDSTNVPPQYLRLKSTWEAFIDSVMREWKTFNIISVLLLSAILTILQIDSAAQDPITRYTALSSLICALISLLFGCMYIIRFGSMRKTYKAAEWALEAKRTRTTIWWNVWVLLAMPAIWLTWSIILYIACIMTFLWRTSAQDNSPPTAMSKTALLAVRIAISSVLGLGLVYTTMILSTFSRYGDTMDKAWTKRINGWLMARNGFVGYGGPSNPYSFLPHSIQPYHPSMQPYHPSMQPYPPYSTYPPYPSYPAYPTGPIAYARPGTPSTLSPAYERMQNDAYGYPTDQKYSNVDSPTTSLFGSRPHPSKDLNNQKGPSRRNSENSIPSSDMYSVYMPYPSPLDPWNSHRPTSQRKDKTDRKSTYMGPNYTTPNLPPQTPAKAYVPPLQHPKGARKKRRLSVPPPDTLPTIPGTPGSSDLSYLTSTAQNSPPTSLKYDTPIGLGIQYGERLVEEPEIDPQPDPRVHFRSPLVSAQESSFTGGSDREAVESEQSSVSEPTTMSTNVPWTPFPSPISPAY